MTRVANLPAVPQSWYRIGRSADLRRGRVISFTLGTRDVAVYRTDGGRVVALDARCPHMGAHLGRGRVSGERLQCALHHWTCAPNGMCLPPSGKGRLTQPVYPTAERYDSVFLFAGAEPRFEIPRLGESDAPRVNAGRTVRVRTSWASLATNAFDIAHMDAVHHRVLRQEPSMKLVGAECLELSYVSRITGTGFSDRIMRVLAADAVHATIECWGGTMVVVRSRAGRLESRLLLCLTPIGGEVSVTPIVARPRNGNAILDALALRISRWLFTAFLRRDVVPLDGMVLRIDGAIGSPGPLGWMARWLLTLPAFEAPDDLRGPNVQTSTGASAHAAARERMLQPEV